MARSDLLVDIVQAGAEGNQQLFYRALEALIAEERAKQHNVLADKLALHLKQNENSARQPNGTSSFRADRSGFLEIRPRRSIDSLMLPQAQRLACMEVIEEQQRADMLRAYNLEPRHRLLFSGPPGNGKTTLAEAIAYELNVPLLLVRYEAVIGSYLGETAVRLSKLFAQVRTESCVLFFDEFDVIGKERGDENETGEIKRIVSSLLLQVDQLPSYVVAVAATNHSELLDRAAWRRFQVRIDLPNPSVAERIRWFERLESVKGLKLGVSPEQLAKRIGPVSYSELEQFALDIQRRQVLDSPSLSLKQIVTSRLNQWTQRSGQSGRKKITNSDG